MEKTTELPTRMTVQPVPSHGTATEPKKFVFLDRRFIPLALFALYIYMFGHPINIPYSSSLATASFDNVKWHACSEQPDNPRFQCSTVKVPLDYTKGWTGGEAEIAVSKWIAEGPKDGKLRKSLFINPGGPGGSGFGFTFRIASSLSQLVLDAYDIIGFDPRGISNTSPRLQCFPTKQAETIFLSSLGPGLEPWAGKKELRRMIAKADAENMVVSEMCEASSQDAGRHMSTTTVVKDIAFLAELLTGKDTPINFYGFSYGTVVGEYLIGMFPDRIGHVVVDGVCDPVNWRENAHHLWGRSDYVDSEKTYQAFLQSCAEVGPDRCALADQNSTMESLELDVDKVLQEMVEHPMVIKDYRGIGKGVLHSAQVREWIFGFLYRPNTWPQLARGLKELTQGNGLSIFDATEIKIELNAKEPGSTAYANPSVECTDALPYPEDMSTEEIIDLLVEEISFQIKNVSRHFAGLDVDKCPRWKMRDPDMFTGLMNQTLSNDILIIGNTADPITSIKHARLLNEIQSMSRLIHHDGFGHCSSAMASVCTAQTIRSYFTESKLPPNNLFCKTDQILFPNNTVSSSLANGRWVHAEGGEMSSEENMLLSAFMGIGEALDGSFVRR
ncbi:Peptidase S33 tripeptidyl aminopeptidase-like, C-terminal [Phaffia rhodozyma]|uniref:Peptidase S33 tripeptidyl aminopeptidase-like, C-terminal n=1 Tax=Phaffia rhodozyma TaxID=264483 RepID=A0A0F7SR38_PHARH|nr:Peptidase S33 tripeptidyl aminopeptidase-like, C-terminal [Phaffia rhodozyma]